MLFKRILIALPLLFFITNSYSQKSLTLEAIFKDSEFSIANSKDNFKWVPQHNKISYTTEDDNDIVRLWLYDVKSGKSELIFDNKQINVFQSLKRERRVIPDNHYWAPSGKKLLLNNGKDLYLYILKTKELIQLTNDEYYEQDPLFSPDGKKIAFVKNYNLYVLNIATKEISQLTTEGKKYNLIGKFDYVTEEELDLRVGFYWSPNSKYLAFYKIDESSIPEFPIVDFIPVHNKTQILRYAKPGDHNAIVNIGVVKVDNAEITWMDIGKEIDIYIPRITWLNDSEQLAIFRMNRLQNQVELLFADIKTGKSHLILEEKEAAGWLSIDDDFKFLEGKDLFVWPSDRSGYNHLYLYEYNGELICPLTSGDWDVTELINVDEKKNQIYFMGTKESIFERHLYKVNYEGKKLKKLTKFPGSHNITMNDDCNYYIDSFSNINTPKEESIFSVKGKKLSVLNPYNAEAYRNYHMAKTEFISFTTEDGVDLNAQMIKPSDFDPANKYPVLFSIYGGPGSQTVRNSWGRTSNLWLHYLAQKGYIIFKLDNRGTGYRGNNFKKQMYRNLGHYEIVDMVNGVKYLRTLPYVDASRIGIRGWSYGGYTTIMCMLKAADYFKVGVAVAPVTDWRDYDSIYTERYMDTPHNNPEGYESSSALNIADNLKGKLLIIHGSADDNVHMSHTFKLIHKFQKLDKQFDLMVYPRKDHSIRGVSYQLYTYMAEYILNNL